MKYVSALSGIAVLLALLAVLTGRADAQATQAVQSQEELHQTIASLDAALFDSFNRCDLETFSTFFIDDAEFYHDQDGESRGKEKLTAALKKNICGGDVRRELVPGTLQVYPMKGYGALEIGGHRFYHPKSNTPPGEAQFIHLWQHKDGAWKITRVISFDHHTAAE
jgi:ketosteroid isomerase-like protein